MWKKSGALNEINKIPKTYRKPKLHKKIWIGKPGNINSIELVVKTLPSTPIPTPRNK